jgi:hypothetical protein
VGFVTFAVKIFFSFVAAPAGLWKSQYPIVLPAIMPI